MSFYTAACKTCRFSVDYERMEKPVRKEIVPRSGWAKFWLGSGLPGPHDVDWDMEYYVEREKLCDNYVLCRLNPKAVQKPKASWCSHYKEDPEKA